MSSIFLFEFKEDLPYLQKVLKTNKRLRVISTNVDAAEELNKNKIKFTELNFFYNSKESLLNDGPSKNYLAILKKTLNIPNLIEEIFFINFKNFYKYKWNIFNDFFYPLKSTTFQVFYYSFCLDRILTKHKVKNVYVRYNHTIEFEPSFVLSSTQSIFYNLLKLRKKKVKITIIKNKETFLNKQIKQKYQINSSKVQKFKAILKNYFQKYKLKKKLLKMIKR